MSWMLARLASATQDLAPSVDAAWTAPLDQGTRAGYRTFLTNAYGFQVPVEATFAWRSRLEIRFLQPRIRSGRIASDLLALALGPSEYRNLARTFPAITGDETDAFGWLYASERTMLTAPQILERVARAIPNEIGRAASYLTTYGGITGQRWAELGALLDRVGRTHADRIVEAARTAMLTQLEWLTETESSVEVLPIAS